METHYYTKKGALCTVSHISQNKAEQNEYQVQWEEFTDSSEEKTWYNNRSNSGPGTEGVKSFQGALTASSHPRAPDRTLPPESAPPGNVLLQWFIGKSGCRAWGWARSCPQPGHKASRHPLSWARPWLSHIPERLQHFQLNAPALHVDSSLYTPWSTELPFFWNFGSISHALASTTINYKWPENF